MKKSLFPFAFVAVVALASAVSATENLAPHLELRHGVRQLVVDGKPFLILGGELRNSSSSSREYMKSIWPRLVEKRLNTVLGAVTWELIEPVEGKFDFSSVDSFIEDARKNNLKVVFLWFASWKNGLSSYPPYWVKTDPRRFPWVKNRDGKTLDILTTFSDTTRDADAKAFAALMRHIREVDGKQHTALMMQVENEVGIRDDSRDHCPAANEAFGTRSSRRADGLSPAAQRHLGSRVARGLGGKRQQDVRHLGGSVWSGQAGFRPIVGQRYDPTTKGYRLAEGQLGIG